MSAPVPSSSTVVVVGAGPAGLTAAAGLAGRGVDVLVLEREQQAGGIPRHSDHTGYGLRDLHRVMTGPRYAQCLDRQARDAGARVVTGAMVTGWATAGSTAGRMLEVTSPSGRSLVQADAVVLATGARERPRAARLVPGDRVAGVLTTGQLQNQVHVQHRDVGRRAVVVGAELVSWSAVLTLREAGVQVVRMVSAHRRPEAYGWMTAAGRLALRVPVDTQTRLARIVGSGGRVAAVELAHADGRVETVPCDTVVLTGDWVPDHELARLAGLAVASGSRAPVVDGGLRTALPGVFAIGNLVHPVDTADVCALDGRHVVDPVLAHLRAGPARAGSAVAGAAVVLDVEAPLRWVAPGRLVAGEPPPRDRLLLGVDRHVRRPVVEVRVDGEVQARIRLPWPADPGRVLRVPASPVLELTRRVPAETRLRLSMR